MTDPAAPVSVVIPTYNEAGAIGSLVTAVLSQDAAGRAIEVVVADDGSSDGTLDEAHAAGAVAVERPAGAAGGNPAAARNRGAAASSGDPIVFLDADCRPRPGWLAALLSRHQAGAVAVGGALDLPPGLSLSARADYYCGWYHVHSRRSAGPVRNHPPGNFSIRRAAFFRTGGFTERQPIAYAHEELELQAALAREGTPVWFEPAAAVTHANRPGWGNLLRRNYRWAYSAIGIKAETGAARLAGLYRHPRLVMALAAPSALAQTGYIIACWARAGVFEPLLLAPAVLAARSAYAAGMIAGGIQWLRHRGTGDYRPRWE